MANTFWIIFFIGAGYLVELLFRRIFLAKYFVKMPTLELTEHGNWDKFTGSLAQILPDFIGLIFFFFGAYFAFTIVFWVESPWVDLVFMAVLIVVTWVRLIQITSKLIFSPTNGQLRVVPMQDRTAPLRC